MRPERKYGLLLVAIGMILSRFVSNETAMIPFLEGLCFGLGLVLLGINLLPQSAYDQLYYRKRRTDH